MKLSVSTRRTCSKALFVLSSGLPYVADPAYIARPVVYVHPNPVVQSLLLSVELLTDEVIHCVIC